MRLKIILSFFILFLLIISALTFWWKAFSNYEKTDNAYIRGSITNISSRISGYVEDVPGVLNGDPRVFKETKLLKQISRKKQKLQQSFFGVPLKGSKKHGLLARQMNL